MSTRDKTPENGNDHAECELPASAGSAISMEIYERVIDLRTKLRLIPKTGTGTLTSKHYAKGAIDALVSLSNWIDHWRNENER